MPAHSIEFEGTAWSDTQKLPEHDPWRLYLERDDDELEPQAALAPQDLDSSYLWTRRLAELNREDEWGKQLVKRFGTHTPPVDAFGNGLRLQNLETRQEIVSLVPLLVLIELPGTKSVSIPKPDVIRDPAGVIADFEN